MARQIYSFLHEAADVYAIDRVLPEDREGWGSTHPIFDQVIRTQRPNLIIEVGTWKGGSALHMAECMTAADIDGEIVCVDSFLGSPEHWIMPQLKSSMMMVNGRPRLYEQFLSNVNNAGLQKLITPFPAPANVAAQVLRHRRVQADLIYIDGAHDYASVRADLKAFWPLVRPGGTMIGDDFLTAWPGVVRAASEFAEQRGVPLGQSHGKWVLVKPSTTQAQAAS